MYPMTNAAYLHYPTTLVYATDDKSVVMERQKALATTASDAGVKFVETVEIQGASHSSYLSRIPEVVAIIEKVAAAA